MNEACGAQQPGRDDGQCPDPRADLPTTGEPTPDWEDDALTLLGRDPGTGLIDTDRALQAICWLTRAVYSHAKTDRAHHDKTSLLAQIQATQALANTVAATQHVRIAQYAATTEALDPATGQDIEHTHRLGDVAEFTDADLAPALCWGPRQATRRVDEAVDAVTKTPRLLDAMGAGTLDAHRVAQVTWELVEAGEHTCARVQDSLLERGLIEWTPRQARERARRLVRMVDPAAATQTRAARVKDEVGVNTLPGPIDGLTDWRATLPADEALAAFAAVDTLARQLHTDTTTDKTLGQCRADAMCDLILGNAHVETNVTVLVPITTDGTGDVPEPQEDNPALTNDPPAPEPTECTKDTEGDQGALPVDEPDGADETARENLPHDRTRQDVPRRGQAACDAARHPPTFHTARFDWDTIDWDTALAELVDTLQAVRTPGGPPPTPAPAKPAPAEPVPVPTAPDPPADPRASGPVRPDRPPPDPVEEPDAFSDVEVPGIGVIPADAIRSMLRTVGTTLTRALVDARTGTLAETACRSYRPTAAIRRFVTQRDVHCRFPGCQQPAAHCDLDHVTPWPRGATTPTNLLTLCRHHHRTKHQTAWTVTMDADGTCSWISRSGHTYTTIPGSTQVLADLHVTPGPPQAL